MGPAGTGARGAAGDTITQGTDLELARQRATRWRAQAFGRLELWERRLAADGLDEAAFLELLGETPAALRDRCAARPAWLTALADAFAGFLRCGGASAVAPDAGAAAGVTLSLPSAGQGDKTGFLDLLAPLLHAACARLRSAAERLAVAGAGSLAAAPGPPFTADAAVALLYPNLASRLLRQISRTLVLELHVARLLDGLAGDTAEERFRSFAAQLRRPEVALELLQRYPVLARQAALRIEQWLETSRELLARLATDWQEILDAFTPHADPGPLVEVRAGAGDPHHGGRTVTLLRFASRFRLVYKPKPLAVEAAFQELLAWVNARGFAPPLRRVRVLARDGYGWVEHVDSAACGGEEEVERFYRRQGGLLALLYALDAADIHSENLIAAGEHPVLVDLEALFHPWIGGAAAGGGASLVAGGQAAAPARAPLPEVLSPTRSVLRIGLLPERTWAAGEEAGVDVSGLGGAPGQWTPRPVLVVDAPGTDEMRFDRRRMEVPAAANRPRLAGGAEVSLPRHAGAVAAGFELMYRLLLAGRDELLREGGPLDAFAGAEVRILLRPTLTYEGLLTESFHPDVLGNALLRDQHFDRLWAAVESEPWLSCFIADERRDLERGDVPIFTTRADSRDLWTGEGERLPAMLAATGLERVREGLRALGPADLVLQLWTVQGSLAAVELTAGTRRRPPYRLVAAPVPAGRQELLAAAAAVADRLAALASREHDRTMWYGLAPTGGGVWQFGALQADLYGGMPGIALFLAQLAAVTGEARHAELARGALAALLPLARPVEEASVPLLLLGAWSGWGGVIYTFAHLAALWGDPVLLDAAESCVARLPELIDADETLDLIDGAAGCLAALLALHELRPAAATLTAALRCGERLLARAEPQQTGIGWRNVPAFPQALTGFSHGTAGIAWALLRLAAATGEERFATAAREGLAFERSLYLPERGNWADRRGEAARGGMAGEVPSSAAAAGSDDAESREPAGTGTGADAAARDPLHASEQLMCAWCHGATGIGLSRLAALSLLDDPAFHEEIAIAIRTTLAEGFGLSHCLCHGDLGCLDFLLLASRQLGDAALAEQVYQLAGGVLGNVAADGWRFGMPAGAEPPGLMLGLAGIGYGFLRLAFPERVPSVLLLETRTDSALALRAPASG
jgi:type 2 lantibiotic biosynthesis protein LanM